MQQAGEAARRDLHAEPGPQQANDLCQRHAHLGVQLDDERGQPGAELHRGRAECVGGLEAVSALHAPPALRAAADLDVEAAHDGAHLGEFFLILRGHAGHFDGPAAVGTRPRRRRRMGLVNPRRAAAASLPPVPCTGPAAWAPATPLRPVLGEGRGLPSARAAGGGELLLEVFATTLPPVPVAGGAHQVTGGAHQVTGGAHQVTVGAHQVTVGARQVTVGARQVVDQFGVLPLELLNALVPQILLSPERLRTAASAALASHAPRIGSCAPNLHSTSRIFSPLPGNQRREMLAGEQQAVSERITPYGAQQDFVNRRSRVLRIASGLSAAGVGARGLMRRQSVLVVVNLTVPRREPLGAFTAYFGPTTLKGLTHGIYNRHDQAHHGQRASASSPRPTASNTSSTSPRARARHSTRCAKATT